MGGAIENSCEVCKAIALKYKRAWLDFWLNASEQTRNGCRAIGQLLMEEAKLTWRAPRNFSVHLSLQLLNRI
jgi:hypothetical protein